MLCHLGPILMCRLSCRFFPAQRSYPGHNQTSKLYASCISEFSRRCSKLSPRSHEYLTSPASAMLHPRFYLSLVTVSIRAHAIIVPLPCLLRCKVIISFKNSHLSLDIARPLNPPCRVRYYLLSEILGQAAHRLSALSISRKDIMCGNLIIKLFSVPTHEKLFGYLSLFIPWRGPFPINLSSANSLQYLGPRLLISY